MKKIPNDEELREIWWGDNDAYSEVEEKVIGHTRWSVIYRKVFRLNDTENYLAITGAMPATEMQDSEHIPEGVSAKWVSKKEVTVTVYE